LWKAAEKKKKKKKKKRTGSCLPFDGFELKLNTQASLVFPYFWHRGNVLRPMPFTIALW
jgi:hypothetical protein